jgi:hypothetical protein
MNALRFEFVHAQEVRELVPWLKGFERSALNYQVVRTAVVYERPASFPVSYISSESEN